MSNCSIGVSADADVFVTGSSASLYLTLGRESGFFAEVSGSSIEVDMSVGDGFRVCNYKNIDAYPFNWPNYGRLLISSSINNNAMASYEFSNFVTEYTTGSSNTDRTQYQSLSTVILSANSTFNNMYVSSETDTVSWYLTDRTLPSYGKTLPSAKNTLLLNTSGTLAISASQVWVFLDNVRMPNGQVTSSAVWWPFSTEANPANWRNTAVATWMNGAWNVDNNHIY